jgi:hypothetical protein
MESKSDHEMNREVNRGINHEANRSPDTTPTIRLYLSCHNLPKIGAFAGEVDPRCDVYLVENSREEYVGSTETKLNDPNPTFMVCVNTGFYFERQQLLKIKVMSKDSYGTDVCVASLSNVALGRFLHEKPVIQPMQSHGYPRTRTPIVTIRTDTTKGEEFNATFSIHLRAQKNCCLASKLFGWTASALPFQAVCRLLYDKTNVPVGESKWIPWSNTLKWSDWPVVVKRAPLRLEVATRLNIGLDLGQKETFVLQHSFVIETQGTQGTQGLQGTQGIQVTQDSINIYADTDAYTMAITVALRPKYSMADFIARGMKIHMGMAVDFTASNGQCDKKNSLHFLPNYKPGVFHVCNNDYFRAIQSVTTVLDQYAHEPYQAVGFGAYSNLDAFRSKKVTLIPFPGRLNTCADLLASYLKLVPTLTFASPTHFSPFLEHFLNYVESRCKFTNDEQNYFILFVSTDGKMEDMDLACDLIYKLSLLPVSIVIAGVGSADFTNMHILDGDDVRLCDTKGRPCARDIVQFVNLSALGNDEPRIAAEVLREIPRQVLEYADLFHVSPGRTFVDISSTANNNNSNSSSVISGTSGIGFPDAAPEDWKIGKPSAPDFGPYNSVPRDDPPPYS